MCVCVCVRGRGTHDGWTCPPEHHTCVSCSWIGRTSFSKRLVRTNLTPQLISKPTPPLRREGEGGEGGEGGGGGEGVKERRGEGGQRR